MNFNYNEYKDESSDNILSRISKAALEQKEAEVEVAKAEEALKAAQDKYRHISEFVLPALMDEAEQSMIKTKDGIVVEVKDSIKASIPVAMQQRAFKWLQENGHEKLIKSEFIVNFNRENRDWAQSFEEDLKDKAQENHFEFKKKEAVHPQTLTSFVKEQLEEGVPLPFELFGIYKTRVAKIK